jgi:hypothetical protein
MHKVFGVVVPVLVSLFFIQIVSDVLYLRAVGYQPSDRASAPSRPTIPRAPVHEVDREASAGSIIT